MSSVPVNKLHTGWCETAACYHLVHALALGIAALVPEPAHRAASWAIALLIAGAHASRR